MRDVYKNVELIRKTLGRTKTSVAAGLGLSLQGYRHIANGSVELGAERLRIIADSFGVEPGVFFDDELTNNVITNHEAKRSALDVKSEE